MHERCPMKTDWEAFKQKRGWGVDTPTPPKICEGNAQQSNSRLKIYPVTGPRLHTSAKETYQESEQHSSPRKRARLRQEAKVADQRHSAIKCFGPQMILQKRCAQMKIEADRLREVVEGRESEVVNLRNEVERLRGVADARKAELVNLGNDMKVLQRVAEDRRVSVIHLDDEMKVLRGIVDTQKAEEANLNDEMVRLRRVAGDAEAERVNMESERELLREIQKAEVANLNDEMRGVTAHAEAERGNLQNEIELLRSQAAQAQARHADKESELQRELEHVKRSTQDEARGYVTIDTVNMTVEHILEAKDNLQTIETGMALLKNVVSMQRQTPALKEAVESGVLDSDTLDLPLSSESISDFLLRHAATNLFPRVSGSSAQSTSAFLRM
ncbi:hypothetical protein H0H92_015276 [Tricholoma furcatifolium]|nr:hypothetical protein H0H92_015276 [Tricholoma furcatifolium]